MLVLRATPHGEKQPSDVGIEVNVKELLGDSSKGSALRDAGSANRTSIFRFCFFTSLYNRLRSARFATSPRTPVFPDLRYGRSRASLRRPVMKTYAANL